jgi:N-acetylmuramic acid 6-phosphate etherase
LLVVGNRKPKLAPTEQRNSRSHGLDRMSAAKILRVIQSEDARIPLAIAKELPKIARAVDAIVRALRAGGRLIYAGAGTSGRLAVLDASECPPTFGVSRETVVAVIAGGARALTHAVEGAEDSAAQGAKDLAKRRVSRRDVVVGIAASGSTPYVLGALQYARRKGAATIGVTSNPRSAIAGEVNILIAPQTGPEVITGSTRMKAGTAQKLVLNMLSTAAMVRLGHVYDNWMIDVALTNRKLQRRAARILQEASGAAPNEAARALRQAARVAGPRRHALRVALIMLKKRIPAAEALERLHVADGNLRRALGESR